MSNLDLRRNPKQTSATMKKLSNRIATQNSMERKRSSKTSLNQMIIVENFRTPVRPISARPINPSKSSTLSRHTPIRSNSTLPKVKSSSSAIKVEEKEKISQLKEPSESIVTSSLKPQTSVLQRRFSLNETLNSDSEFGTIRTDHDSLNGTMTVELRGFIKQYREKVKHSKSEIEPVMESTTINDDRATLDLLDKIRHGPHSVPIGPMPLSQQACRFELPFDLKILELLTPIEYLARYCRVSPRRQYQFKRIFNKYRNRDYQFESSDLYSSIRDLHKENFTTTIYDELCQLIDLNGQMHRFTFEAFAGILALSERLLCNAFLLKNDYDTVLMSKDPIERCDFDSLTRKFDGLKISEKMKHLLNTL